MEQNAIIDILLQEIKNLPGDVKAEAQLALAIEKGLAPEDFMVSNDNRFVREYSRDIVEANVTEDPRKKALLQLHLSRGGIYDQLPEGLFFAEKEKKPNRYSAGEMAAEYQYNRKREEEIRRFFLPFDNDFFWQRIQIEQEETQLLKGLQTGILNDYFVKFWNLPRSIPKAYLAPLILLLPYAHKVTGDLTLTGECLEQLLLEQVTVSHGTGPMNGVPDSLSAGLGEAGLGVDMICGEAFREDAPVIEFAIGPLQRSRISDYLAGGALASLLETFGRFFVPAGLDISFSIRIPEERRNMIMVKEDGPVLGYSSVL